MTARSSSLARYLFANGIAPNAVNATVVVVMFGTSQIGVTVIKVSDGVVEVVGMFLALRDSSHAYALCTT